MNRNDPRVIKTLRQIDDALLTCLKSTSQQKLTVDQLCETALINRSTFYKYYLDKYDLIENYLERVLNDFKEQISGDFITASVPHIDDETYITSFGNLLTFINDHREQYQTIWRADIERNIYEEMTMLIHHAIYQQMLESVPNDKKKKAYCDYYAYLFSSNVMALVHWWFMNDSVISIRDCRKIMADNMRDGLFLAFKNNL